MAIKGAAHGIRGRGSYNVTVKLEGQIFKFNFLTQHSNILLAAAARSSQKAFARSYQKKVIENIKSGGKRFHYPPHSAKYKKWKAKLGGGGSLLFWGGTMAQSVVIKHAAGGTRYSVGIEQGAKRGSYGGSDKARLSVSDYANVLDHGSHPYMPARPVFSDTFKEHMGGMKGLKKAVEIGVIKHMAKAGIRVIKL